MEAKFRWCLEQRKIYETPGIGKLAAKELTVAERDLNSAERSLTAGDYKWATSQAYYAMFHAARALLYSAGYKERSHYCLLVAVEALFVSAQKLPRAALVTFEKARKLRELADYELEFSKETAERIVQGARDFITAGKELLDSRDVRQKDAA